jgi:hypothetical protein
MQNCKNISWAGIPDPAAQGWQGGKRMSTGDIQSGRDGRKCPILTPKLMVILNVQPLVIQQFLCFITVSDPERIHATNTLATTLGFLIKILLTADSHRSAN